MNKLNITTSAGAHGFQVGDAIDLTCYNGWHRLGKLWSVLTRPRIHYVSATTTTTLELTERRPTWAEWRAMIWRALTT